MEFLILFYLICGLAACLAARKKDAPVQGKILCLLLFPLHFFVLGFLAFWGGIVGGVMDEVGGFWDWLNEDPENPRRR